MTISERIRLIRQQNNISQNELAKAAGINVKSLSRYELGSSIPPANALKAIAESLDVSLDYLAGGNVAHFNNKTIKLINKIEELAPEVEEKLLFLANAVIRDYKAGKAYLVN